MAQKTWVQSQVDSYQRVKKNKNKKKKKKKKKQKKKKKTKKKQTNEKQKKKKKALDASLLITQHYKVQIKSKVEQSWKRSSALPYTSVW